MPEMIHFNTSSEYGIWSVRMQKISITYCYCSIMRSLGQCVGEGVGWGDVIRHSVTIQSFTPVLENELMLKRICVILY